MLVLDEIKRQQTNNRSTVVPQVRVVMMMMNNVMVIIGHLNLGFAQNSWFRSWIKLRVISNSISCVLWYDQPRVHGSTCCSQKKAIISCIVEKKIYKRASRIYKIMDTFQKSLLPLQSSLFRFVYLLDSFQFTVLLPQSLSVNDNGFSQHP